MNIADITAYSRLSQRTAASVHVAKWSPDGEYFATVGKVNMFQHKALLKSVIWSVCDVCSRMRFHTQDDCLLKVWYPTTGWRSAVVVQDLPDKKAPPVHFSFIYLAHPRSVTGMSWRKTSKFMPK